MESYLSKFRTTLPVPVKELFDLLPEAYFINSHTYDHDKQEVCIIWEADKLSTGYTFPVEYPLADLRARKLPKAVKEQKRVKAQPKLETAPTAIVERNSAPPVDVPDHAWSKERLETEKAMGAIEYQGVEAHWRPLEADHVYREGYFYRKILVAQTEKAG